MVLSTQSQLQALHLHWCLQLPDDVLECSQEVERLLGIVADEQSAWPARIQALNGISVVLEVEEGKYEVCLALTPLAFYS